jgi:hypothetical protein
MGTEIGRMSKSVSFFMLAVQTILLVCICFLITACGRNGNPVPSPSFTPPLIPSISPVFSTPTLVPTSPILVTPTPACISGLTFMSDVTIPDFSVVAVGTSLDKQWLVQNSGSCNWDSRYRLRLVGGDAMGASPEQALYPARTGMQATLRIVFTAPSQPGEYLSQWQAFDSQGNPFGQSFFIKIIVQ